MRKRIYIFTSVLITAALLCAAAVSSAGSPEFYLNPNKIFLNGSELEFSFGGKRLDSYLIDNVTYVPLRSFANSLGKNVEYNEENKSVTIIDESSSTSSEEKIGSYFEYQGYYEVSLVQLIANPEKYENKVVRVGGIINVGFEDDYLFLTKEDRSVFNIRNAISMNYRTKNLLGITMEELEKYSGSYAFVKGTFRSLYPEMDEWMLADITDLEIDDDFDINTQNIFFGNGGKIK